MAHRADGEAMVQTIRPDGRGNEPRGVPRLRSADAQDLDGVLYRLGRLQRVLVDVRAQVRELRTYSAGVRADEQTVDEAVSDDLRRRLERIMEALDEMRDDFDITRDSIEESIDHTVEPPADIHAFRNRSLPAGA